MGRAIDTISHATGDRESGLRQCKGERAGMRQASRAGIARTDNRHLGIQQQAGIANNK